MPSDGLGINLRVERARWPQGRDEGKPTEWVARPLFHPVEESEEHRAGMSSVNPRKDVKSPERPRRPSPGTTSAVNRDFAFPDRFYEKMHSYALGESTKRGRQGHEAPRRWVRAIMRFRFDGRVSTLWDYLNDLRTGDANGSAKRLISADKLDELAVMMPQTMLPIDGVASSK
ncbi:hypothetical protein R3P38DRAFT_2809147 [Favolaschia claudopus]|uniref:Uncharacterized protein n=1 Tax=Favolaschia claudopus TaxID=2862362 RepID=A0AAV9ZEA8_9AGAR